MVPEGYFTEDHDVYLFFSAHSGAKLPNQHVIHNVRFYDIKHLHDTEDQDTEAEKRLFNAKPKDVVRQKIVTSDRVYTVDAYNQQIIRHNKYYSKIVSEFIANSEMIVQHLHNLPHHEIVSQLTDEAGKINQRFALMYQQFTQYESDVDKYKQYLEKVISDRDENRNKGHPSNKAN